MSKVKKWLLEILVFLFLCLHLIPVKSVIVGVKINPPWQPEGHRPEAQIKAQRQSIANAERAMIYTLWLGGFGAHGIKQFKYIPYFAATVSVNAYLFLRIHPLVTSIEDDRVGSATTAQIQAVNI